MILLHMWYKMLEKLKLEVVKMPCDVRTRWNSTFDMLRFALKYHTAVDDITGNKASNLRQYELGDNKWKIADQLCDTLKVRIYQFQKLPGNQTHTYIADLQGCDTVLFIFNT
jgi:hypothetical protein